MGVNLGRAGGAGVPGHVHVHVVPRWNGDTNFMTTVAETRVLPEPLRLSWEKLREALARPGPLTGTAVPCTTVSHDATPPEGDVLPEDLDVTAYVGPYLFPEHVGGGSRERSTRCSRSSASWAGCVSDNWGLLAATVLLVLIGAYHFLTAWPLKIDQTEALLIATRTVGFPVGHSTAQLAWHGLRSRPAWRILLYSADEPPTMRGLVELDGVDGHVLGEYTEPNPEDWSQYGLGETAGQT